MLQLGHCCLSLKEEVTVTVTTTTLKFQISNLTFVETFNESTLELNNIRATTPTECITGALLILAPHLLFLSSVGVTRGCLHLGK